MSFVLDALKKQEAERDPDAAAALSLSVTRQRRQRLWIGLFLAALLGNVVLLAWLFGGDAGPGAGSLVDSLRGATTREAPSAPPAATPRAEVLPEPAPSVAPAPPPARRVTLAELPAEARRRFPGLVFSTHIYAEDPSLRAVVANGQRLTEGDRLGTVEIAEISEAGVVLAFEDYLVEVPVVARWETP